MIIFHIQLADHTTCAVEGETYNPSKKRCQCGSELSCTIGDRSGKLRIFHQYWFIFQINCISENIEFELQHNLFKSLRHHEKYEILSVATYIQHQMQSVMTLWQYR